MIDCHVHCRDWFEDYKETIGHILKIGEHLGFSGIIDKPNTDPSITSRDLVRLRLREAEKFYSSCAYFLDIGLSSNERQIKEAVQTYNEFFPKAGDKVGVAGFKVFAGKSVGNLTVSDEQGQRRIYRTLGKLNYQGVLCVHCEKESLMVPNIWDPNNPITHCYARPKEAEIESIKDQIRFAREEDYTGKLHIHHVTTPESVLLINQAKNDLRISCGVTPAHLLIDNTTMKKEKGILLKVNPPLRDPITRRGLLGCFLRGEIDVLESDHAPHTYEEKTGKKIKDQYMSGLPNFPFWLDYIGILKQEGASEELLEGRLHDHVNEIWGLSLPRVKPVRRFNSDENLPDFYAFNLLKFIER